MNLKDFVSTLLIISLLAFMGWFIWSSAPINQPILAHTYKHVEDLWATRHPKLRRAIEQAMEDGVITNSEYYQMKGKQIILGI